jgi:hypothetical protein
VRSATFLVIILEFTWSDLDALGLFEDLVSRGPLRTGSLGLLGAFHQQGSGLGRRIRVSGAGAKVGDLLPVAGNVFRCQGLVGGEMNTSSTFPTDTGSKAWPNFEESASCGAFIGTEEDDCGGNVFRLEFGDLPKLVSRVMIQDVPLPQA